MKALIILSMVLSATSSYAKCNRQSFNQEVTLHSNTSVKQDIQEKKPAEKRNNLDRQTKRD